jgi:hypothetical protein
VEDPRIDLLAKAAVVFPRMVAVAVSLLAVDEEAP